MKAAALSPALAGIAILSASAAWADLPRAALDRVGVQPPDHAALPAGLRLRDPAGRATPLAGDGPLPRILVFADYGCATLCGPALSIVGARLAETGLAAGRDYRLEVAGLDPASTGAEAQAFVRGRLPRSLPALALVGDAAAIRAATAALGYRYVYDPATRSFAHPVAAFVLTADGRLSRTLSEVALTAPALRQAILDARAGAAPNLVQAIALACHGALEAVGRFDGAALAGLRIGGVLTVLLGAGALIGLSRRRRRAS